MEAWADAVAVKAERIKARSFIVLFCGVGMYFVFWGKAMNEIENSGWIVYFIELGRLDVTLSCDSVIRAATYTYAHKNLFTRDGS